MENLDKQLARAIELAKNLAIALALALALALTTMFGIFFIIGMLKIGKSFINEEFSDSDSLPILMYIAICSLSIWFIGYFFMESRVYLDSALNITLAPKIWLIEYSENLVKDVVK